MVAGTKWEFQELMRIVWDFWELLETSNICMRLWRSIQCLKELSESSKNFGEQCTIILEKKNSEKEQ